jgi:predicted O-linked N-acetylglucosamine transferase (SPINDLY family)
VQSRLRAAAGNAGITPERLIFADHASGAQHLVRHRLADLFLDTTPYNAHTTASDALFAGLPLLTVRGKTFPGRVAESLLRSLGLEALVASNIKGYEDEAVALANQPARLDALRRQLAKALPNAPLFDTAGFTRNLENLYRTMVAETEQG